MIQIKLDPGGDGGGVKVPGIPGGTVKPPSKDGVLDGTAHYGQVFAPLIAILLVAGAALWLFRNVGNFIGDLIKKASVVVGALAVIGLVVLVLTMKGK